VRKRIGEELEEKIVEEATKEVLKRLVRPTP
jgi:hypothetical protein